MTYCGPWDAGPLLHLIQRICNTLHIHWWVLCTGLVAVLQQRHYCIFYLSFFFIIKWWKITKWKENIKANVAVWFCLSLRFYLFLFLLGRSLQIGLALLRTKLSETWGTSGERKKAKEASIWIWNYPQARLWIYLPWISVNLSVLEITGTTCWVLQLIFFLSYTFKTLHESQKVYFEVNFLSRKI